MAYSNSYDIIITVTVLQHITDEIILKDLLSEACRVSKDTISIFERIEPNILGDELNLGRPIEYYSSIMSKNGFTFISKHFIRVRASYILAGITRKLLNRKGRKEGEPLNSLSLTIQRIFLPFTKIVDKFYKQDRDLAMLIFKKNNR